MFGRHQLLAEVFLAVLICLSLLSHDTWAGASYPGAPASSQADERESGIELYEKGDTAGAIRALQGFVKRNKNDIRAWHHLGLSFAKLNKTDEALKAHEKAAKLGSQLIKNLSKGVVSPIGSLVRFFPYIRELTEAADSAQWYLGLSSNPSVEKVWKWQERVALLRGYVEFSQELSVRRIFTPQEVTTKARIISKPIPEYTEEARKNHVTGRVSLLLVLSADGKVLGSIPTDELPDGLTEKAIEAARKIRFDPASIDGKPVSQFIKVEYNFNIY